MLKRLALIVLTPIERSVYQAMRIMVRLHRFVCRLHQQVSRDTKRRD